MVFPVTDIGPEMRVTGHTTEAVWESKVDVRGKARLAPDPEGLGGGEGQGRGSSLSAACGPSCHEGPGRCRTQVSALRGTLWGSHPRDGWSPSPGLSPCEAVTRLSPARPKKELLAGCRNASSTPAHKCVRTRTRSTCSSEPEPMKTNHRSHSCYSGRLLGPVRPTGVARGAAAEHAPHPQAALPVQPAIASSCPLRGLGVSHLLYHEAQ